jgi:hypothetical protein
LNHHPSLTKTLIGVAVFVALTFFVAWVAQWNG